MDHQPPPQPPPGTPAGGGIPAGGPDEAGWPLAGVTPDWADDAEWARMCAGLGDDLEPADPEEAFCSDPDSGPPAGWELMPAQDIAAQADSDAAEYAELMARLTAAGVAGYAHVPGQPPAPGLVTGPAAGFGQGRPLDAAAPSTVISGLADEASGEDRAFADVTDDQLMGLLGARQRLASRQHWELLTGVAEFIRRRPDPSCPPAAPGKLPGAWNEHAAGEVAAQLRVTPGAADDLLDLAWDLTVKLPMTAAALRDGIFDLDKVTIVALHCRALSLAEARAFEAILFGLDAVGEMTWGMVRDRAARAVMEVNPDAARKRRERAARDRRVELRPELSGNSQIAGRELPPAAALAASQNLTARAQELREAGVDGTMDDLRVLAYLEMLGALDPLQGSGAGTGETDGNNGSGHGGRGPDGPRPGPAGPGGGAVPGRVPAGFRARVNLTIPLTTLLGLAGRPGLLSGTGPVDPALARELAAAAARDPRSTWCVTVTGPDSRPVAHGCGRPPPRRDKQGKQDRGEPGPGPGARDGPVYTPGGDRGPPGSGTIRLDITALTGITGITATSTGADGTSTGPARDLVFALETLAGPCDHKLEAAGHDPGVRLRHLTGILNACCTFPPCRRPEANCDYEHSLPFEQGGRTCLCDAGPVCRHDHRAKQATGWHLEHAGKRGWFRWTTPSGRTYLSRPTQYPD